MTKAISDTDRLILIARVYSCLKGEFTSQQLYDFIIDNNLGFRCKPSIRVIGATLSRSSKFNSTKLIDNKKVFEVV